MLTVSCSMLVMVMMTMMLVMMMVMTMMVQQSSDDYSLPSVSVNMSESEDTKPCGTIIIIIISADLSEDGSCFGSISADSSTES